MTSKLYIPCKSSKLSGKYAGKIKDQSHGKTLDSMILPASILATVEGPIRNFNKTPAFKKR